MRAHVEAPADLMKRLSPRGTCDCRLEDIRRSGQRSSGGGPQYSIVTESSLRRRVPVSLTPSAPRFIHSQALGHSPNTGLRRDPVGLAHKPRSIQLGA